jgi:hypothetical protein
MNKKNNLYFVVFGNDRYNPDLHLTACKNKFDYLKDARLYAKNFSNAYIFKAHFDGSDIDYIKEIKNK